MNSLTRALSWAIALCGLWEAGDIAAALVPGFGTIPVFLWNHIVVGMVLIIAGARAALTSSVGTAKAMHWIAAAVSVWLIVATFVLRAPVMTAGRWNDVIVGLIVIILSAASGLLLRRRG